MNIDLDFNWKRVCEDNDGKALERIFKETFRSLCFYAFQISSDQYLAEEVVQEVFIKLWQNRGKINIKESFRSYLFQTVHNLTLTKLAQQYTKKNVPNNRVSEEVWQLIIESHHYNAYLVEKLEAEDTQKIINQTIEELPHQCREVFLLSKSKNKPNEEIASMLNISVNTVRTHIYRALEKISEALNKKH